MRYLPLTDENRQDMLKKIGVRHIDDLFKDVCASAHIENHVDLPFHKSEMQVENILTHMAGKNITANHGPFFCGTGAYKHHVPASVDHIIQRSEFMTSYTPYQPEIAQGTLQYLFEFQTQIAVLTGMEVANASLYDGSTAAAEAVLMAHRITKRHKSILSGQLHPHYTAVIENISEMGGFETIQADITPHILENLLSLVDDDVSCVVVQNPDFFGHITEYSQLAAEAHAKGILFIVVISEIVSCGLLKSAGDMGADIVVGEGQSLGNPLNFGGPYLGFFATRQKYVRQMPGRICGQTVDIHGKRGFVLTLSTREQHIRRDKATSNICTNSGLCALAFTIHMTLLGGVGLRQLARINHARAVELMCALSTVSGVEIVTSHFFNEFSIRISGRGEDVIERLAEKGILGGVPASRLLPNKSLDDVIIVAATEVNDEQDIADYKTALQEVLA